MTHPQESTGFEKMPVEAFIKLLDKELIDMIATRRKEAGGLAAQSLYAGYEATPDGYAARLREGYNKRIKALSMSGEASGMVKLQAHLPAATRDLPTINQAVSALHRLAKKLEAEMSPQVDGLMVQSLRYTESHPEHGCHQAAAVEAQGELYGLMQVVQLANGLYDAVQSGKTFDSSAEKE